MTLSELIDWVDGVPASLPEPMRPMAERICESFQDTAKRLVDLIERPQKAGKGRIYVDGFLYRGHSVQSLRGEAYPSAVGFSFW
jgi:hypothetical protein